MAGRDAAAQALGIEVVDVSPGRATLRMIVTPTMLNGHGMCHGGLVFALADAAMASASNSRGPRAVAVSASVDFLLPAHDGDVLVAEAVEVHHRGRTGLYDVVVTRTDGTVVARFHGRTQDLKD
jgi:acyl-CoA thioesterase